MMLVAIETALKAVLAETKRAAEGGDAGAAAALAAAAKDLTTARAIVINDDVVQKRLREMSEEHEAEHGQMTKTSRNLS